MKSSNGTAGIVALVVAGLGLIGIVAADQMTRHQVPKSPVPAARNAEKKPVPPPAQAPTVAPTDSLHLTPMDGGMPPPGETLTI